jgi:hypothetical protein
MISFDEGSMDHIPERELAAVGDAAHAVVREAKAAGVWVFGGGIVPQPSSRVSPDGSVTPGPIPQTKAVLGGFAIVQVASRDQAIAWAAKFAAACRCDQEVREIPFDPEC